MAKENENNIETTLVLEGGGMRGMFTCGVTDEMMAMGLSFPAAIGVSAGACFGVNIKSLQPGRALRYNSLLSNDPRYRSIKTFIKKGEYFDPEFCYHVVPYSIDVFDIPTFNSNPMRFDIVCTNVETGEPVYHTLGDMDYNELEWLRASATLPVVSKPVHVHPSDYEHRHGITQDMLLMDGGLSDSIPLRHWQEEGFGKSIVILTQPLGFRKKPTSHMGFMRWWLKKYPKVVECLERRHEMYNRELEYVEAEAQNGRVLLIAPPEALPIGRVEMKPEKLKEIYEIGRETCKNMREKILTFIGQK